MTWTLLLIGMVLKYGTGTTELGVRVFGTIHGFVFLTYCVVVLLVGIDQKWSRRTSILGLLAAVPPFATIPFERHVEKNGLIGAGWRLRHDEPEGPIERLAAWAIAHPVAAAVVAFLAVSLLFAVLLWLGPPVPKS